MSLRSVSGIIASACTALLAVTASAGPASVEPTASAAPATAASQLERDCSRIYGGERASCRRVPCSDDYYPYLGTWSGEFFAYVREKSKPGEPVFRPYHDTITYAADDCVTNTENGDAFIVGHWTDVYPAYAELPAKEETGLLVPGVHA